MIMQTISQHRAQGFSTFGAAIPLSKWLQTGNNSLISGVATRLESIKNKLHHPQVEHLARAFIRKTQQPEPIRSHSITTGST
ncbi:hypothetical protein Nepgr_021421 [Nepenthes gracilis]|uniref:Uncharacterized protein n=1 Tax=Nepenthes gracilis TaxID=150966 RepID=A0AAD3SXG8_NEPGR|nr:hypothetical protein Nepgr_021421 [Nepenthes gracilis]